MKIIFTIEDLENGDTDAKLELYGVDILEALDIIQEAKDELLQDRISMN